MNTLLSWLWGLIALVTASALLWALAMLLFGDDDEPPDGGWELMFYN